MCLSNWSNRSMYPRHALRSKGGIHIEPIKAYKENLYQTERAVYTTCYPQKKKKENRCVYIEGKKVPRKKKRLAQVVLPNDNFRHSKEDVK